MPNPLLLSVIALAIASLAPTAAAQDAPPTQRPEVIAAGKAMQQQVIDWRRHFHQYPELSNREERTSAEVAKRLGVSPATIGLDRQALWLGRVLKGPEHRTLRGLALDQVRARLKEVSRAQLARELGVSSSAVYRYCRNAGLST